MTDGSDDEWIRSFESFAAAHPIPTPPPIVRQRLRQAFERHHGRGSTPTRQTATLIFDSREHTLLAGVRGRGEPGDDRYQRTFAGETHGVLLDVEPLGDGGEVRLEGQVLGIESRSTVWEVVLVVNGESTVNLEGDENGCFQVSRVPSGVEVLRLSNGELTIDVADPVGSSDGLVE